MILFRALTGALLTLSLVGPAPGQEAGAGGPRFAGELMRYWASTRGSG